MSPNKSFLDKLDQKLCIITIILIIHRFLRSTYLKINAIWLLLYLCIITNSSKSIVVFVIKVTVIFVWQLMHIKWYRQDIVYTFREGKISYQVVGKCMTVGLISALSHAQVLLYSTRCCLLLNSSEACKQKILMDVKGLQK